MLKNKIDDKSVLIVSSKGRQNNKARKLHKDAAKTNQRLNQRHVVVRDTNQGVNTQRRNVYPKSPNAEPKSQ